MVPPFCSNSVAAPVVSGLSHLIEHLPTYILDSTLDFNPSLTMTLDVISYFCTIRTIKFFSFFFMSPILLFHGDSVTF